MIYYPKILKHLSKPLKPILFSFKSKNFKPSTTIVLFSEARGGSTWLMEILVKKVNAISIFEPISRSRSNFKKFDKDFSTPFYFGQEHSESILKSHLTKVLSGKENNGWSLQFNSFSDIYNRNSLVIKLVSVNMILPWVIKEFDLTLKPIFLIRHPLAILSSRKKYANNSSPEGESKKIFQEKDLQSKDHPYWPYLDYLNKLETGDEQYVAGWCIRNQYVLKNITSTKVIVVFYEQLVMNPQQELDRILSLLKIDNEAPGAQIDFRLASGTSKLNELKAQPSTQLEKWKKLYPPKELDKFQVIMDHFQLDLYNTSEALPLNNYWN